MSEHEDGWDLVGVGKLAKAIPPEAWKRLIKTACDTFESAVAPITQTTYGLGRWIAAKFDTLAELEKINAAAAFQRAREKIDASGRQPAANVHGKVIVAALAGASQEDDEDMRELWANLLAREFTTADVHPQIVQILTAMTPQDARTFAEINQSQSNFALSRIMSRGRHSEFSSRIAAMIKGRETVSEALLESLGLVRKEEGHLMLTALGNAFLEAVQGPTKAQQTD